jgi:hypothetical protein
MNQSKTVSIILLLSLILTACSTTLQPTISAATPPVLVTHSPTLAAATTTLTASSQPTSTSTPVPTPTATLLPLPSDTPTPTLAPTYVKLRAEVIVDQAVCHYGPGAAYLYKYGLVGGSNLEVIARLETATYIEVQAIGGSNPCWVNAKWMNIKGDIQNVQPVDPQDVKLPLSPYYGALAQVSAQRDSSEVSVSWTPLILKAGDDSEQYPYLVEAWICKDRQIVFTPIGSHSPAVKITDEPGCTAPSHACLYGVEKHGYTHWLEIPWPPAAN